MVLIAPGTLPKTSSGKMQRRACRAALLAGKLEALAQWRGGVAVAEGAPAADPLQAWLTARLGAAVDLDAPLAYQGLDSLRAIELAHALEERFGLSLSAEELFGDASIRTLLRGLGARERDGQAQAIAAGDDGDFGLSHGQRALFFLHRLSPGSAAYNIARAVRIGADLDAALLRRCLEVLVLRHPALRTTFHETAAGPGQRIHADPPACFDEEDAEGWSDERLHERASAEANRPFDLESGPLLRVRLFRRPAGGHVLLLVIHHMVADLWSLALLMDELWTLYAAKGDPGALPPSPRAGARDFVRDQEERLSGPEGARIWSYWREQLKAPLPVLDLPADRPRSRVATHAGAAHAFGLGGALAERFETWARAQGATLYMALCAAFAALLQRYTGQEELVIGTPTSGRSRARFAGLVGYCVNPVALRLDLSGILPSARSCTASARPSWPPSSIRTSPFRCWWSSCSPCAIPAARRSSR